MKPLSWHSVQWLKVKFIGSTHILSPYQSSYTRTTNQPLPKKSKHSKLSIWILSEFMFRETLNRVYSKWITPSSSRKFRLFSNTNSYIAISFWKRSWHHPALSYGSNTCQKSIAYRTDCMHELICSLTSFPISLEISHVTLPGHHVSRLLSWEIQEII